MDLDWPNVSPGFHQVDRRARPYCTSSDRAFASGLLSSSWAMTPITAAPSPARLPRILVTSQATRRLTRALAASLITAFGCLLTTP